MMKPRFKIDQNNSWIYDFAVYERVWIFWFKVYNSNNIKDCEKYIDTALTLPRFYYPNTNMGMK